MADKLGLRGDGRITTTVINHSVERGTDGVFRTDYGHGKQVDVTNMTDGLMDYSESKSCWSFLSLVLVPLTAIMSRGAFTPNELTTAFNLSLNSIAVATTQLPRFIDPIIAQITKA